MTAAYKLGSLFDGIGGFPFVAERYGIEPVWASEIDKDCINVTRGRFPNMRHLGDITKINGAEIPPVDVITFGSPCQDLSIAGKRAGLDGERSGLFMEAVRIIREMREATSGEYPDFAVWENVPGAQSSNEKEDFRAVVEELCKVADETVSIPRPYGGNWTNAGLVVGAAFSIAWRVLDAQHWGVPHRRRRIFLVADYRGRRAAEILFKPEGLRGHIAESVAPWERIAGKIEGRADEASRIYGFNGGAGAKANTIGYAEEVSPSLRSASCGLLAPCICEPQIARTLTARHDSSPCADRGMNIITVYPDVTGTLCGSGAGLDRPAGIGSEADLCVVQECIPVNMQIATRHNAMGEGTGLGIGNDGDPAFTLQEAHSHAVGVLFNRQRSDKFREQDVASTQCARQYKDATDLIVASVDCRNGTENAVNGTLLAKEGGGYAHNCNQEVRVEAIVRRLTPMECERLQGFPDRWTERGADGKIMSDSARYRMLGNSVALPCVDYIMSGIKDALVDSGRA